MSRAVSSHFGSTLLPPCLHFRSEGKAKAERRHGGGILWVKWVFCPIVVIPKKPKTRMPLLRKKSGTKWHPMTITIGMRPLFTPMLHSIWRIALMHYLTDFSTASKMLNLNNPILSDRRERSVGSWNTLLSSVPKGRDIETTWQKSVISYIRALHIASQI